MRLRHHLLATLLVIGGLPMANAAVVTFDSYSPLDTSQALISTGGLDFSSGSVFQYVWTGNNPNGNGTPALILGFNGASDITKTGGGPFNLNSFEMAISWYSAATSTTVDLTANFFGGGSSSQTLTLIPSLQTYNLNLNNVTSVDVTAMASGDGYWVMDNVTYNASSVPEPASLALVGFGLIVAAKLRFRRK